MRSISRNLSHLPAASAFLRLTGVLMLVISVPAAHAADAFAGIKCGGDIPALLTGKEIENNYVVAVEKAHEALKLNYSGGIEGENFFLQYWRICGNEYVLLLDLRENTKGSKRDKIADVRLVPEHSKSRPQYSLGDCQANGRQVTNVLAVLENVPDALLLPARWASRVNAETMKFETVPPQGLSCPRNGIASVDGGL